ncbi:TrmH family RNA methyltransferase [Humidisolicoccus flavus]|uniref:TrmH family RNA methyltransferase n=1 Tax=Humidisolicoccus flavus TaxID=3111414 RepID=UPI0032448A07
MHIEPITRLDDPRLRDYVALTDVALRRVQEPAEGLYIAESSTVLERALQRGHQPRSVLLTEKWLPQIEPLLRDYDVPVFLGDESTLESLTGFHLHRGALAAMHRPVLADPATLLDEARRIVILDGLVDHTNVGAVFRSVAGLGADLVLVTDSTADPLYRRSVRVSMGTVLQVPWTKIRSLREFAPTLHEQGFSIAALALGQESITLDELAANAPAKLAIVLGSEGHGLSAAALRASDITVEIPMMHGVDSLNVAAASAVALWALRAPTTSSGGAQ